MYNESILEYEHGRKVGTYSEEMLKDLLYASHDGYIETIKIYRNRPLTIYNGFSPIVYQATISGLSRFYEQYAKERLFDDNDRFLMQDVVFRRSCIKDYVKRNFEEQIKNKEDVEVRITIICYLEHIRTMLFQGRVNELQYHEIERLESDTLMWGIDPGDKYASLFIKENFELLKKSFEYRGSLNNLSLYTRVMLSCFMEVKVLRGIVDEIRAELQE